MSITLVSPRESELQKQVIELAESLRNLGWEFELYKQGARATHQKLLDKMRELKAKLAEYERRYPKSALETHPMIPNSKCKCEHWQRCEECTPSLKGTP